MMEKCKNHRIKSLWGNNNDKSHWSFERAKAYTVNLLDDTKRYFICSLPYQIAIKENLLSREQIEDEMSEADFDAMKFSMEMESLFYGDTDGAFFTFDDISNRRRLKNAVYPNTLTNNSRNLKIPDLVHNERRILSVDVALMASKKQNNDASAIIINSAIPTNNNYTANVIYMENHEGLTTDELALVVRRLFSMYKCTDLVLDTAGVGTPVFDMLLAWRIPMDRGDCQVTVHSVAKSWTRLKQLSLHAYTNIVSSPPLKQKKCPFLTKCCCSLCTPDSIPFQHSRFHF